MNCGKARERLIDALDGALSPTIREALASHLAVCAECRREQHLLLTMREMLSRHGAMRVPADLTHLAARVAVGDDRRPTNDRQIRSVVGRWSLVVGRPLRWGLAATMAAGLFAGVVWHGGRAPTSEAVHVRAGMPLREVAEAEELHQAFAVQQSLDERDGLLLFAPRWAERGP